MAQRPIIRTAGAHEPGHDQVGPATSFAAAASQRSCMRCRAWRCKHKQKRILNYDNVFNSKAPLQFKGANEAPIMAPGFSKLPLCKMMATASTPSNFMASIGIVKFSLFPFQLPSLTQRRTTLV